MSVGLGAFAQSAFTLKEIHMGLILLIVLVLLVVGALILGTDVGLGAAEERGGLR